MARIALYDACVLYPAPLRDLLMHLALADLFVLAAAFHGRADLIVTFNLDDFPASSLAPHHIEAIHPDAFIGRLWSESAEAVLGAVRRHRASLKRPPKTAAEYLTTLDHCRFPETAARLRPYADEIEAALDRGILTPSACSASHSGPTTFDSPW